MAQHIVDNPQLRNRDLPVDAAVDTTGGTGTADRPTSVKLFPFLASGVELATGFFNRVETRFVGVVDGFRVGNPVVSLPPAIHNILAAIESGIFDVEDLLGVLGSHLSSLSTKATAAALSSLSDPMFRRLAGVDAGALTVAATGTAVAFTGVNLVGRVTVVINVASGRRVLVTNVVDPVGATPGTLTLAETVQAGSVLIVPFYAVPHSYSAIADTKRVQNITPEWSHYVEPLLFINQTSQPADNTYQFGPILCLDYGCAYFQIDFATVAPGTRACQFNLFGKMDNAAWPAAGTINAAQNINTWMQYTAGGTAFGAVPVTAGRIVCRVQDAFMFDSLMVELVTSATSAHNTAIAGYVGLAGRGR